MLPNLLEYHRPTSLAEALALLNRSEIRTVPLAGGTSLVGSGDPTVGAVVDLQDLGLHYVESRGVGLHIGAMTTLQQLAREGESSDFTRHFLARAACAAAHRIHRNVATIGGTVAVGDPNGDLLLCLIALNAQIVWQMADGATRRMQLEEFATNNPRTHLASSLITEIVVPKPAGCAGGGLARAGRTPRDKPIVNAAALVQCDDSTTVNRARVVIGGVSLIPFVWVAVLTGATSMPVEELFAAGVEIPLSVSVPGDFRGSAEYRRALEPIVARRALQEALEASHET
ncbi:MAG: FAD binding domain-containing protein [Anaerolineae bacterium]|nr:FAD binding domain-containing protein [Anaerolineae bacterium]